MDKRPKDRVQTEGESEFHNRERFNAETAGARSLRMLLGALRSEGRKDDGHVGFLFLRSMGGFSDEQKTNL